MDTQEIVQGLKGLRQCDDPDCASFKCKTIDAAIARLSATCETPANSEWVFVHATGEWRCHCGYVSTSWDRFTAHFNAPPIQHIPSADSSSIPHGWQPTKSSNVWVATDGSRWWRHTPRVPAREGGE